MLFPERYLITPNWCQARLFSHIEKAVKQEGVRLVQIRAHALSMPSLETLLNKLVAFKPPVQWLINSHFPQALALAEAFGVGVHLQSHALMRLTERPLKQGNAVAASCHNLNELKHAEALAVDFAVLSPVKATASHPESRPLGWPAFQTLCAATTLPVYALGGMTLCDSNTAKQRGAVGVAGINW